MSFLAGCSVLLISLSAFRPASAPPPLRQVTSQYHQDLKTVLGSLETLHEQANQWHQGEASLKEVQAQFVLSRKAYKRCEALVTHLAPEAVKDYINGAPLPHVERKAPNLIVIEPEGYQRLDELLFGEEGEDAEAILAQSKMLSTRFEQVALDQIRVLPTDRLIFEAARFGIVRLVSLGITGFDTPTSGQAIPEATASLEGIQALIEPYYPAIEAKDPAVQQAVQSAFEDGIAFLKAAPDFDHFDRMTFIREHADPLYAKLLDAHLLLNYETVEETTIRQQSVNYKTKSMFSAEFLNAYYYTDLQAEDDTPELRELGRLLFFDPILSSNNKRACASCHNPSKGFTDGRSKSLAMDFEGTLDRNAPTLLNALYADRYFHDLRADKPASQIEHVIHNEKEFHSSYPEIFEKLQQSSEYRERFQKAFPKFKKQPFKRHSISTAMVAYLRSLQSMDSPVDLYLRHESDVLSADVKEGFNLFMGKAACGTCHFAPMFNGTVPPDFKESESEVLGVLVKHDTLSPQMDTDMGRAGAGKLKEETEIFAHSFKTVTVRNVSLTAPYMHNGAYTSLEEVVDFYNRGGGQGMGLDVPNQTLPPDALGLTKQEQKQLVVFMEALTDTTGLNAVPSKLPVFEHQPEWNNRTVGGEY